MEERIGELSTANTLQIRFQIHPSKYWAFHHSNQIPICNRNTFEEKTRKNRNIQWMFLKKILSPRKIQGK